MRKVFGLAVCVVAMVSCTKDEGGAAKKGEAAEPAQPKEPLRWRQVAMGKTHACAARSDGALYCWGTDLHLEGGEETVSGRRAPHPVKGVKDVVEVVAGPSYVCARSEGGEVTCWGDVDMHLKWEEPTVVEGLEGATALAAGVDHLCALREGAVWCLGDNDELQLGVADADRKDPAPVKVEGLSGVTAIAAGRGSTCAVADGGVQCWGANRDGSLGDGSKGEPRATPAPVAGLAEATNIAAEDTTYCATTKGGKVHCWGGDAADLLDDSDVVDGKPHAIPGTEGVVSLRLASGTACARTDEGGVVCWGDEERGRLGRGFVYGYNHNQPVKPVEGVGKVVAVASNERAFCALADEGARLACWGDGDEGVLSNAAYHTHRVPKKVKGVTNATALAVGSGYSCARVGAADVQCWGAGTAGVSWGKDDELTERVFEPVSRVSWAGPLVQVEQELAGLVDGKLLMIAGGRSHIADNDLAVWQPSEVVGLTGVTHVVAMQRDLVIRKEDGSLHWLRPEVDREEGQVVRKASPHPLLGAPRGDAIAGHGEVLCVSGVAPKDHVECFVVTQDDIDPPSASLKVTPHEVPGTETGGMLTVHDDGGCVVLKDQRVRCFDDADEDSIDAASEVPGLKGVRQVTAGGSFGDTFAAVTNEGALFTWSRSTLDHSGLRALDRLRSDAKAQVVEGIADAVEVRLHDNHGCLRHESGEVSCWGENDRQQLGVETPPYLYRPTTVALPANAAPKE